MSGTLQKQNQSLSFIPQHPCPQQGQGGCSPAVLPLSPVPVPLTVALSGCPQDHNEYNSSMARSQTNTARLEGLRPGMVYVVQVRARTVAGYGKYSGKMCFQTLTDGECAGPCPRLRAPGGLQGPGCQASAPAGSRGFTAVSR